MAWIEMHQTLANHRKTLKLMRLLKVGRAQAIGTLFLLWTWCLDNAPDGDLSSIDDEEIATALDWDMERAGELMEALRGSGFVDGTAIHDWDDYAGRLIDKRNANAKRMRESRQHVVTKQRAVSQGNYMEDTCLRTCDARALHVQGLQYPTVPNSTEPNSTMVTRNVTCAQGALDTDESAQPESNQQGESLTVKMAGMAAGNETGEQPSTTPADDCDSGDEARHTQPCVVDRRFDEFWSLYPRKTGKIAARKSFGKIKMTEELHKHILAAVLTQSKSEQWRKDGGQYIPNPATWLNQGRWDDEAPTGGITASALARPTAPNGNPFRHRGE